MANSIPVPHPGETIREDVLEPLGMSVNQLAKALGITATRLNDVVRGRRESPPIPLCAWRDTSGLRPNSG